MRKVHLLASAAFACLLASCSQLESTDTSASSRTQAAANTALSNDVPLSTARKGVLHVRLSRATVSALALQANSPLVQLNSLPTQLASTLQSLGTRELEALFPIDPRWEKRMRSAGLDQWYILRFDEKTQLQSALTTLHKAPGVELVEPQYEIELFDYHRPRIVEPTRRRAADNGLPFDDPGLADQWHYHNDGRLLDKSVQGADANVFEAWKHETGKPSVIISVVDGGIDQEHEDLVDNLWTNPGEIPDNGKDDDGNGYIDDVHGWNFNANTNELLPDAVGHGTHVAGTVAACNNNGIGVSGVAGGNGDEDSGVRLMSCQTFAGSKQSLLSSEREDDLEKTKGGIGTEAARAIVYGANNGAVISQNSWGYRFPGLPQIPSDVKAAIDYFRKWAGCDNEGNQLPNSPMKGGVVIFAAGNDDTDYLCFPAAYEATIAVAAHAPNWKRASYTNRGAWVDVIAPGGDDGFASQSQGYRAGEVYSTLPGNRYGYLAGTSMACPHVSGIAALIVSKQGRQGFTAQQLEQLLLTSFRPQSVDRQNPDAAGRLGLGYIDAGVAFAIDHKQAPEAPEAISVNAAWTSAQIQWNTVADPDDETAVSYRLYLSPQRITEENKDALSYTTISALGMNVGDQLEHIARELTDDTNYYVGIAGVDRWGNVGKLKVEQFRTKLNHAPQFTYTSTEPLRVSLRERVRLTIPLTDPDGHAVRVSLSGEERGVSHSYQNGELRLTIAKIAPTGRYEVHIKATDEYGKAATLTLPFEIYDYVEPHFLTADEGAAALPTLAVGNSTSFDPAGLVRLSQGLKAQYSVSVADPSLLSATLDADGQLHFVGKKAGKTLLRLSVSDGISQPISRSFEIRVAERLSALVYALYPVPTTRELNIVLASDISSATAEIISPTGRRVSSHTLSLSGGKAKLDVKALTPGAYVLKIVTPRGTSRHSFVKL